VPVVAAFTLPGLRLWFWSHDHCPMHFHAEKTDQWEIRVDIMATTSAALSFTTRWGSGPSGREQKALRQRVVAHRLALVAEWSSKVMG
jgi:hypothetical protein